jgi:anion-transporting  ArsA/GET3 family ATPase
MSAQIIICCGSGGVGKTTTSAALALKWAAAGERVCVLTIDPAKRLADSLNIGRIGGEPTAIPLPDADGRCDAVMLDVEETFEKLIHRFSSSPETASNILNNRYFQFAATRLGGVHEYMAAEKVRELAVCGQYDVVIVDTPPTRNALDFLRAPERMAELMDGSVMRWMTMPATGNGWRAIELGSEAVTRVLRILIGHGTISEIAQFFSLFRDLWDGFRSRSMEVTELFRDASTRFLLVTSPSPAARSEALFFLEQLKEQKMPFGGFLINRMEMPNPANSESLPADGPGAWDATLAQLKSLHDIQSKLSSLHEESVASLIESGPPESPIWRIPHQGRAVNNLEDLNLLGEHLPTRKQLRQPGRDTSY